MTIEYVFKVSTILILIDYQSLIKILSLSPEKWMFTSKELNKEPGVSFECLSFTDMSVCVESVRRKIHLSQD